MKVERVMDMAKTLKIVRIPLELLELMKVWALEERT